MRNFLFVALLGGVAAAGPRLHPVHTANGSVSVDGHTYASQKAYFESAEWQDSGGRCGTPAITPVEAPAAIAATDCSTNATNINQAYLDGKTYVIQVVMHVVSKTDGTGDITADQVKSQIQILNEDYGAIAGSHGAPGNNASIKFVLARFDPQGNPTDGIDRVQNNTYFEEGDSGTSAMKTALHWDTSKYLNLYSNDLDGQGLLGYATFPWDRTGSPNVDGVVLAYQSVGNNPAHTPYDLGASATHEIGHWLGLFHTFQSGCGTANAPYTTGDLLSDTVREKTANYGCAVVADGCNDNKNAPIENYMDYSQDMCMTTFTPEQIDRMRCSINNYRVINTEPTAAFSFTNAGLAVTFTNTSTDAESMATALHYNWDFGDGMTSTDQNPVHTYAMGGNYDVTLEVVDPMSAAGTLKQSVTLAVTGGGSNGNDAGVSNPMGGDDDGGSSSSGGGCCQAPKGGLSFVLTAIPVGFVMMRRRRRK
ncbi:MAG: M43 family zinc metalloprotease [Kofleriaceae bacterium]